MNGIKCFNLVIDEEIESIGKKRGEKIVGIAFSGGGIRSATFNLGVLQALAKHNLLKSFDYLSTVSGGGYIGAFFSSLIFRKKSIEVVTNELANSLTANGMANQNNVKGSVNYSIFFLRKYSNYLTPKRGLFTTDTLAAVSQWFSNVLLNQLLFSSLLLMIFILVNWLNNFLPVNCENLPSLCQNNYFDLSDLKISRIHSFYLGIFLISIGFLNEFFNSFSKKIILTWVWTYFFGFLGVILICWNIVIVNNIGLSPHRISLGVPIITLVISLIIILILGIGGRKVSSEKREWWFRLGGVNIAVSFVWISMFMFAIYIPKYLISNPFKFELSSIGLISYIISFITAKFGQSKYSSGIDTPNFLNRLSGILPYVVVFLIFLSLGILGYLIYNSDHVISWFMVFLGIGVIGNLRFDVNIFSLHNFYRNRLTRCYLGATNPNRNPNYFTGFDKDDDIKLSELSGQKPFLIINTALNISNSPELAWQQRKAGSFTFTPKSSGFNLADGTICYRQTNQFSDKDKGPFLGSLIAVSGAAASPNSGYHTNPVMGFIMTIFNARLGRWYGNPLKKYWKNPGPKYNLLYLLNELFTNTNTNSDYLYLSDGGHFENLGIYELIRRQCNLIVAVDVGQDGDYTFEDLGNAIRKCKTDFGALIDINVDKLFPTNVSNCGKFRTSEQHYAIGNILYADGSAGKLIYLKSSLTGDEPIDLINYKLQESTFPHHSTIDQCFDESQFESYRNLGVHIASDVAQEITQLIDVQQ